MFLKGGETLYVAPHAIEPHFCTTVSLWILKKNRTSGPEGTLVQNALSLDDKIVYSVERDTDV